ncbi:MAG: glycosyltransferase family 4 protein [Sandaracinaceae bacterium]
MSHVVVVGHGPFRHSGASSLSAHGLRSWHVARTLEQDGHAVTLVALRSAHTEDWPAARVTRSVEHGIDVMDVSEHLPRERGAWLRDALPRPDAYVGVGLDGCAAATALCGETPVFADLNGAPFAEAQVKAAAVGHARWTAGVHARFVSVLERADRFGACSPLHRGALIGQLGLVGRLGAAETGEELVHVMPNGLCAEELDALSVPARAHDGFVLLLSGGFNTWFDEDMAHRVITRALGAHPGLRVRVLGGGIEGHYTAGFRRFDEKVRTGAHADRVEFLGWVPASALPDHYAGADAALLCDRPGYEGELGARTRVLDWLAAGLPVVMTRLSAISVELECEGAALTASPGDDAALAEHVRRLISSPDQTRDMRSLARASAERRNVATLMAPLCRFVRDPVRLAPAMPLPRRLSLLAQFRARATEAGWSAAVRDTGRWLQRRLESVPGGGR